jgi:hypothetical protein
VRNQLVDPMKSFERQAGSEANCERQRKAAISPAGLPTSSATLVRPLVAHASTASVVNVLSLKTRAEALIYAGHQVQCDVTIRARYATSNAYNSWSATKPQLTQ